MAADYRIRLTHQALDDIEDIRDFIKQDSEQNAALVIKRLFDTFDSLELFPHRTIVETLSDDLQHPVRSIPVRPYVIYFRVIETDKVVVIRQIRHGARRPPEAID